MIPKIIHYCWFGNKEKSKEILNNIGTWKTVLYDYQIIEWNENNIDIDSCIYLKEAYEAKKYAFVSDYVRLLVLEKYGGIYFDTDVEVIRRLDDLLNLTGFGCWENDNIPSTGIMAAQKGNKIIQRMLKSYDGEHFLNDVGAYKLKPNTLRYRDILQKCMPQQGVLNGTLFEDMLMLPQYYFSPICYDGKNIANDNTRTIHKFEGSWVLSTSEEEQEYNKRANRYTRIFGDVVGKKIYNNILRLKNRGILGWIKWALKRK